MNMTAMYLKLLLLLWQWIQLVDFDSKPPSDYPDQGVSLKRNYDKQSCMSKQVLPNVEMAKNRKLFTRIDAFGNAGSFS